MSVVFRGTPPHESSGLARSADPAFDTPHELYDFLSSGNGLAAFSHPALLGCSIEFNRESDNRDDGVACLAAIFGIDDSVHWNATWDYEDGTQLPIGSNSTGDGACWVKTALDRGYRLGFVGELDMHEKEIDPMSYRYTGVVADQLTRESIFDALKRRHTYAVRSPSGLENRILLRADAGKSMMGDVLHTGKRAVEVLLRGKTDLDRFWRVNVIVNGRIVESRRVSGQDLAETFNVNLRPGDNYTFFDVSAAAADGNVSQAITSPIYMIVGNTEEPYGFEPDR
jgi:hypothetical protein